VCRNFTSERTAERQRLDIKSPEPPNILEKKQPSKHKGPVRIREDQIPELIHHEKPDYPEVARMARVEGTVRIEVTINEQGHVIKTKIVSGYPILDQAAIDTVKKWVYEPYILDNKAVSCRFEVDVRFNLNLN
jgi:protein TonB